MTLNVKITNDLFIKIEIPLLSVKKEIFVIQTNQTLKARNHKIIQIKSKFLHRLDVYTVKEMNLCVHHQVYVYHKLLYVTVKCLFLLVLTKCFVEIVHREISSVIYVLKGISTKTFYLYLKFSSIIFYKSYIEYFVIDLRFNRQLLYHFNSIITNKQIVKIFYLTSFWFFNEKYHCTTRFNFSCLTLSWIILLL